MYFRNPLEEISPFPLTLATQPCDATLTNTVCDVLRLRKIVLRFHKPSLEQERRSPFSSARPEAERW